MKKIGPHSRPGKLAKIDGRRAEAKIVSGVRADLTKHCGGTPSQTQKMLIEQAAQLTLRLHLMDKRFSETGTQSDRDSRYYLAWSNSLVRLTKQLGMKGAAQRQLTPSEIMRGAAA